MHLNPPLIYETLFRSHKPSSDPFWPPPTRYRSRRSQSQVIGRLCWFPWWQTSDAISQSHIAICICPCLCLQSIPPMQYHYRKPSLPQSTFLPHISTFSHIVVLPQNLCFTANPCFTVNPFFIAIASLYRIAPLIASLCYRITPLYAYRNCSSL